MKTLSNLFEQMVDPENMINIAYVAMKARGKGAYMRRYYEQGKIPPKLIQLRNELIKGEAIVPKPRKLKDIYEASADKHREILPPSDEEHIVHHLICNVFMPILSKGMYEYTVASIPGRGGYYGKKHMERWIKSFGNTRMYVLKLDIHHFFQTIDRRILYYKLSRHSKDVRFNIMLQRVIWHDSPCIMQDIMPENNVGIPIGFYTSQWFANFYPQDFDHYIKQDLKIEYYMRYMDDMVLMSPDISKLHEALWAIQKYLDRELGLKLKDSKTQLFQFSYIDENTEKEKGQPIDFMGFKFHRNRTTLRKSTLKRMRTKANKIHKQMKLHKRINWYSATQAISLMGRTNGTDTYGYTLRYLLTKKDLSILKSIVSEHSKRLNKRRS